MAFIPAPDVVQVELVYNWDNQIVQNVLHFKHFNEVLESDVLALGQTVVTWWDTAMQDIMPTNISLIAVGLTMLDTENSPSFEYTTGLPLTGTHVSPSLPNNVALCITKRTHLRGRSFRGRIYHPGLMEGVVVGNKVDDTTVASLIDRYMGLVGEFAVGTIDWGQGVLSRYYAGLPRPEAVFTNVISLSSDGLVDSQRRRLPGRGQ